MLLYTKLSDNGTTDDTHTAELTAGIQQFHCSDVLAFMKILL